MRWLLYSIGAAFITSAAAYFCILENSSWGLIVYVLAPPPFIAAVFIHYHYLHQSSLATAAFLFVFSVPWFALMTFPFWNKRNFGIISHKFQIIAASFIWILSIPGCFIFLLPDLHLN